MTAAEIRQAMPLLAPVYLCDAAYGKPTLRWLSGPFWSWFWESRINLGLLKWERKNDCDNFARAYCQGCADAHAISVGNNDEGLAVGEFWYHRANNAGGHAVVCAFTDEGRVFIEPQTGQVIQLTETEINSCFFARF